MVTLFEFMYMSVDGLYSSFKLYVAANWSVAVVTNVLLYYICVHIIDICKVKS